MGDIPVPIPVDPRIETRLTSLESFQVSLTTFFGSLRDNILPLLGGGSGGTTAPGTSKIDSCDWVELWVNGTTKRQTRTGHVDPAGGQPKLNGKWTVFSAPSGKDGPSTGPPGAGANPAPPDAPLPAPGPPWPKIPPRGGGAAVEVPPGWSLYVHYEGSPTPATVVGPTEGP